jgi:galactokinase
VERERAQAFSEALAKGYESQVGYAPEIYISYASNGAEMVK